MKLKAAVGIISLLIIILVSCQSEDSLEFARYYSTGNLLYQSHCQNCHGQHGEGLQALIPPLTDTIFLKKNLQSLPCLVQNGVKGKITILKRDFEGRMPANDLAPIEIAEVLTYAANSFGNKLGIISVETVNGDLAKCK
jgi:mono/diheme cytochrome c family protein